MTKKPDAVAEAPLTVTVRVLKNGAGRISKGFHDPDGEHYFDKGEEFQVSREIADALEDRGFVEIQ